MSDTDFYRFLRDGIITGTDYHSRKSVNAGIRYARAIDRKYAGVWLNPDGTDKYGDDHTYDIQKLVAVVDQYQDYTKTIVATLEWVDASE